MTSPNQKRVLLLDNAVDLLFEIHLMRGDCCVASKAFSAETRPDEMAIEECAQLEESLAAAYRTLQRGLKRIQCARASSNEK